METMFKTKSQRHSEGKVAKTIEEQTAKLPSDIFLWSGLSSLGLGLVLQMVGAKSVGNFFNNLCAPLLIMGLYNKVVKVEGHDKYDK
jgi:hypothetical protein